MTSKITDLLHLARRLVQKPQALMVTGLILLATIIYASQLKEHQPFEHWIIFRYVSYFALSAGLLLSATSLGWLVVRKGLAYRAPFAEQLIVGSAIGLFLWVTGWMCLGFAGLYSSTSFVLYPLLSLCLGVPYLWRHRQGLRRILRVRAQLRATPSAVEILVFGFGVLGLLFVYAPIITPQNIAFDARWYHLPMAERYALEGGIVRFPEGWMLAGYPQLASHLYTWAFCLPNARLFDHIELAAHIEFCVFLLTLASIPVLLTRVAPTLRRYARLSWVAIFLFPELFIYDSNLNGGADHIAAFWGIPLFLVFLRCYQTYNLKNGIPLALLVAAVIMTKYTACGLLPFLGLALLGKLMWKAFRQIKTPQKLLSIASGPTATAIVLLLFTSGHWLKNVIWYRNPLFPLLHDRFPTSPWTDESLGRLGSLMLGPWKPSRDWNGVEETFRQLYQFSFVPHDWATFHRDLPMFGALFTLTVPLSLMMRNGRLLALSAAAHVGVLYWFWTFHQDRYLQAYLPWMSVVTAACIIWAFQQGFMARFAMTMLVGLQLSWGSDAPFFGSHAMTGQPLKTTIDFLAGGFQQKDEQRFTAYPSMEGIKAALPADAVLLRHEVQDHLGIGVRTVADWFQTGISLGRSTSAQDTYELLRPYQITHLMWRRQRSIAFDSYAADIAFFHIAARYAKPVAKVGEWEIAEMPQSPPAPEKLQVLYLGCDGTYPQGLYELNALNVMPGIPHQPADFGAPRQAVATPQQAKKLFSSADFIVHNPKCAGFKSKPPGRDFERLFSRRDDIVWQKKRTRH